MVMRTDDASAMSGGSILAGTYFCFVHSLVNGDSYGLLVDVKIYL